MSSTARVLLGPQMLALHLVAVLAICFAGALGWWQIQAWQAGREDRARELAGDTPRPLQDVLGADDPFPGADVGRPVTTEGRWEDAEPLFVADRRRTAAGADDGVWQVALLRTCPDRSDAPCEAVVPVVLGWAPAPEQGTTGPSAGRPVSLTGWLQPAEQGEADPDPTDRLLPALRSVDLLQQTDQDLYSGYVILRDPGGLRGDLSPVTPESLPKPSASTALRNLLYGVEWWVFAGFAVYLWGRWSRDAVLRARTADEEPPVASAV